MKNFSSAVLALAASVLFSGCIYIVDGNTGRVISQPSSPTPVVRTGFTVRFGNNVSDIITDFRSSRSVYNVGDAVSFQIRVNRPGYISLVILNPEGLLEDVSALRNIPVSAGWNTVPRNVTLRASEPRGRSYIRAYFTPRPSGYAFNGYASFNQWDGYGQSFFEPFDEDARDVAQISVVVQ